MYIKTTPKEICSNIFSKLRKCNYLFLNLNLWFYSNNIQFDMYNLKYLLVINFISTKLNIFFLKFSNILWLLNK